MSQRETATPGKAARRTRTQTTGPQAQEHLLQAAGELFYEEGVRAVGVDAVVERAGVNKMSLYRQFSSKDDLVLAYLERQDTRSLPMSKRASPSIRASRPNSFCSTSTT